MTEHRKDKRIGVRLAKHHIDKLEKITTVTSSTVSQFFRQVIEDYRLRGKDK